MGSPTRARCVRRWWPVGDDLKKWRWEKKDLPDPKTDLERELQRIVDKAMEQTAEVVSKYVDEFLEGVEDG